MLPEGGEGRSFDTPPVGQGNNKKGQFPLGTGLFSIGSGGRIRTYDQRINSPLRYRCATPDQCVGGYIAEGAAAAKAFQKNFSGLR